MLKFNMMDNYSIADHFSLLAKLMDIHGENSFKSKSYAAAAFTLEKLPQPIATLPPEKLFKIRGIGESVGQKITELIETGELQQLQDYLAKTPEGVLEMMNIKGLGPKKIHVIWKELNINDLEGLKTACEENLLAKTKGFGEKTQQNIYDAITYQQKNAGKYLYVKLDAFATALTEKLKAHFPNHRFEITGAFRRQMEVIESLDWVTTAPAAALQSFLLTADTELVANRDGMLIVSADNSLLLRFFITTESGFTRKLFETSAGESFLESLDFSKINQQSFTSENALFSAAGVKYMPPYFRESSDQLKKAAAIDFDQIVQTSSIKGLIHAHSNWSDGAYTIEEMAASLIELGFEYLVLSDHSKAAFYANGLNETRIKEQHRHIDDLNKKLAPFKIFKSIECDILNDGSLDYEDKILQTFDLVITSVHSNLNMNEEKAMNRLLGAVRNKYTTILGHMTGRLLLKRKGYPIHHKTIIDACAQHHVAIEINASPSRLDMDWRWIPYALEQGVMLSIDPDAHTTDEFYNLKYGVLVAQKGGLPASKNLSSLSLQQFEAWLQENKKLKGVL